MEKTEIGADRAIAEAKKGNFRLAEGILRQIYENKEKKEETGGARQEQAIAARNLAAVVFLNSTAEALHWYREAAKFNP